MTEKPFRKYVCPVKDNHSLFALQQEAELDGLKRPESLQGQCVQQQSCSGETSSRQASAEWK